MIFCVQEWMYSVVFQYQWRNTPLNFSKKTRITIFFPAQIGKLCTWRLILPGVEKHS